MLFRSPFVLAHWEFFSRLKQLALPVELYVIPDIEHGTHGAQNPAQCLASQEGAVDWFDFWLNNKEDENPRKADQYIKWRRLRAQRDAALKIPRPPLRRWTSVPA